MVTKGEKLQKNCAIRASKIWRFSRFFVPLHPINQNFNKIMDDYPADSKKR